MVAFHQTSSKRVGLFLFVSLVLAFAAVTGCSFSDSPVSEQQAVSEDDLPVINPKTLNLPSDAPTLQVMLKDHPLKDIEACTVTIEDVQVLSDTGWLSLNFEGESDQYNLLDLRYGVMASIGVAQIPAALYRKIRLVIDPNATVTVAGVEHDMHILPTVGNDSIKIEIEIPEIDNALLNILILDWNVERSLQFSPGSGYVMYPEVTQADYYVRYIDEVEPNAPTVESPTHPDGQVWATTNDVTMNFESTDPVSAPSGVFGIDGFSYVLDHISDTDPDNEMDIGTEDNVVTPCREPFEEGYCACFGEGEQAYNYRGYGLRDDGALYFLDLYAPSANALPLGRLDFSGESFAVSYTHDLIVREYEDNEKNQVSEFLVMARDTQGRDHLMRVDLDGQIGSDIPVEEVSMGTSSFIDFEGDGTADDVICMGATHNGLLMMVSGDKVWRYSDGFEQVVDNLPDSIMTCSYAPTGLLYITYLVDAGVMSEITTVDIYSGYEEPIDTLLEYTGLSSMGWHPDGYLYAGTDNGNLVRISPMSFNAPLFFEDVFTFAPVGFDFDHASEKETCKCYVELDTQGMAFMGTANLFDGPTGSGYPEDGFYETLELISPSQIVNTDPPTDELNDYSGYGNDCGDWAARAQVIFPTLVLDKERIYGNRYYLVDQEIDRGFKIKLRDCDNGYTDVLIADVQFINNVLVTDGQAATFEFYIDNIIATNPISSDILAAYMLMDQRGLVRGTLQVSGADFDEYINGQAITGALGAQTSFSATTQAGADTMDASLPLCSNGPTSVAEDDSGSIDFEDLDDGIWYFHVKAKDDSDNWGETTTYEFRIDTSPPDMPVVTSSTHPSQEQSYDNYNPIFDIEASDVSGIAGYSFVFDDQANTVPDTVSDTTSATIDNQSAASTGTYYLHVRVVNGAGLWSDTRHFMVTIEGQDVEPGYVPLPWSVAPMGLNEDPSYTSDEEPFLDEIPKHWVELEPFILMQREVTVIEYKACMDRYIETDTQCEYNLDDLQANCPDQYHCSESGVCVTGCYHIPAQDTAYHSPGGNLKPISGLPWEAAFDYCNTLGLRLPTEAEWEFAARGLDDDLWPWGADWDANRCASNESNLDGPVDVGSYNQDNPAKDGTHCFGGHCLYDMAGNVGEWVGDWLHEYQASTSDDPFLAPSYTIKEDCVEPCEGDPRCVENCSFKVVRGGGYSSDPRQTRVTFRQGLPPILEDATVGFRCASPWESVDEEVCDGLDNDHDGNIDEDFEDTDSDGEADCVDLDIDGDGIPNLNDNCPFDANDDQIDPDRDGYGEACDPDGETLPVHYEGVDSPTSVAFAPDGTMYVSGQVTDTSVKYGTVMSFDSNMRKTGQVYLVDMTRRDPHWKDYRVGAIAVGPNGAIYTTDDHINNDDGIWKIVPDEYNQLTSESQPDNHNGDPDSTVRFAVGNLANQRGLSKAPAFAFDPGFDFMYVVENNKKDVRRFPIDANGNLYEDPNYPDGEIIWDTTKAMDGIAIDTRGWLYIANNGRLYRMKLVDGQFEQAEEIGKYGVTLYVTYMTFDASGNLLMLHYSSKNKKWPFRNTNNVPSESGYLSKIDKPILDAASQSNKINMVDESKHYVLYGPHEDVSLAVLYPRDTDNPASLDSINDMTNDDFYMLHNPQGMSVDPITGAYVIASTDNNEVIFFDLQAGTVLRSLGTSEDFNGL